MGKERSMRRRQLKGLIKRLKELAQMELTRDQLLLKLGAAKSQFPAAWRLVIRRMDSLGGRCEYELDAMHELSDQIRRQPVSHPEFQAQFRQQAALPGTDVSIHADDVLHRRIHLPVLAARGESPGQQQGLVLGFLERMNERPHPGHGRIKFTLAVMFFGVAHGREQLLQLLVFHGGQMPVGIHRQNQQIEEGLLLGARQISQINFHGKSLPEVEADFNRRRSVSGLAGRKKHRRNNCERTWTWKSMTTSSPNAASPRCKVA
jgi:hypothetical protein